MLRLHSIALVPSLGLALAGCLDQSELVELDLGVDVRLDDVQSTSYYADHFLAVGAGGVVVDQDARQWDLGDAHLRAVDYDSEVGRWWVAGDDGFVAFANDDGSLDWQVLEVPTDADLQAITFWAEEAPWRIVIVGTDILLVGLEVDTDVFVWDEPYAPNGGWGRLRDVVGDHLYWIVGGPGDETLASLWAVGEEGRVVASQGSPYEWKSYETGIDADLNCTVYDEIHGDKVMLTPGSIGGFAWIEQHPEPRVDVIGCGREVLGADRRIYGVEWSKTFLPNAKSRPRYVELMELDWQPRAFDDWGLLIVGDGGHVARWDASH